jgi:hypothetical protein
VTRLRGLGTFTAAAALAVTGPALAQDAIGALLDKETPIAPPPAAAQPPPPAPVPAAAAPVAPTASPAPSAEPQYEDEDEAEERPQAAAGPAAPAPAPSIADLLAPSGAAQPPPPAAPPALAATPAPRPAPSIADVLASAPATPPPAAPAPPPPALASAPPPQPPLDYARPPAAAPPSYTPYSPGPAIASLPRPRPLTSRAPVHIDELGKTPERPPTAVEMGYEQRLRASFSSAQGLQGPLDGSWVLSGPEGDLYSLELVDRTSGVLEGAWRDLRRPGAINASGFVDDIQRYGGQLTLRFYPHGREPAVATLMAGVDGRWRGELTDRGARKSVTLKRN